ANRIAEPALDAGADRDRDFGSRRGSDRGVRLAGRVQRLARGVRHRDPARIRESRAWKSRRDRGDDAGRTSRVSQGGTAGIAADLPLAFAAALLGLRELRLIAGSAATLAEPEAPPLPERPPSDLNRRR